MSDTLAKEGSPTETPPPPIAGGLRSAPRVQAPSAMGEEVDLWMGAYSGWKLVPSLLGCLLLTVLIGWGAWMIVPPGSIKMTFLCLASLLWAVQLGYASHRIFGYNYRLTTRRLFRDRGLLHPNALHIRLEEVESVTVRTAGWERLVGLGRIEVTAGGERKLVLLSVRDPSAVATLLREAAERARAPVKTSLE